MALPERQGFDPEMMVRFYIADKARERLLAASFGEAVVAAGDQYEILWRSDYTEPLPDTDVACIVGVKNNSHEFMMDHWRAEARTIYWDKGYVRNNIGKGFRGWSFWRASINGHHPISYMQNISRPSDRWDKLGIKILPRVTNGKTIVYAGSSQKYCDWHGLGGATKYAVRIIKQIKRAVDKPVIYRPKPSWRDATPISGTIYSRPPESIGDVLKSAHCLVTHGSNAAFEAICAGVPSIVMGPGVARPICSDKVHLVGDPPFPSDRQRLQWCYNLAYTQFTMNEIGDGFAWDTLRKQVLEWTI